MSDLTHIHRTQLPWRTDDGLTECGRPATAATVSRDEAVAQFARLGQQRFAMVTCMTCMTQANVHYRVESDRGTLLPVLEREIRRVMMGRRLAGERDRLVAELEAIAALIAEHRAEFDGYLTAKAETTDLTARRAARRRGAR